jgi:hypothetical protein
MAKSSQVVVETLKLFFQLNRKRNVFELASYSISRCALHVIHVENVAIVTREINSTANHADEEALTTVFATGCSEEFIGAVDLLCEDWDESEDDQG